ncbi:MAG TPA: hypothetical protein VF101_03425 [Gaiellaceae bacterium]
MRRFAVAGIVFLVAGTSAAATTSSGLFGFVRRGPIVPVCVVEQPCDGPARNMTLVFWRNGKAAGRTTTSKTGAYRIRLASGVYTMRPAGSATIGRGAEPAKARVVAGRFRRVDFFVDTGIR